ncbi:GOLPH3/VPS74 family protein [Plantactinospora sp. CA-294935]|uniref:GOLPH3/VPS74 family protein n=1 Tax=Plantactinospora sp. CA-294935 TaxID=3240012 RepID=UPI003D8E9596
MQLADDFWRLAHDDVSGKSRLNGRAAGLGLAAALLAELAWAGKINASDGRLWVVNKAPPADVLGHTVLEQLVAQPQHTTVRIWLDFLAHDAVDQVAQRLWRAGHVRRKESRRLLRPNGVRWVPVDWNQAHWPAARLSLQLRDQAPMSQADAFLAGLAAATGLDEDLLLDAPTASRGYLRHLIATTAPPLRELLTQAQAAVGESVLAYRT